MNDSPYTPDAELDALIAAGLGDVPRDGKVQWKKRVPCQCGNCRQCRSQRYTQRRRELGGLLRPAGKPKGWRANR